MIVDDEPHIRSILDRVLTDEGYETTTAGDGKQAIELMRASRYDLIITDIVMPQVNGIEVLHAAIESDPEYPVIMITAYPSADTAAKLVSLGATDYITKPFSLNVITATVAKVIERNKFRKSRKKKEPANQVVGFDRTTESYSPALFGQMLEKEIGRSKIRQHICSVLAIELDEAKYFRESKGEVLFDDLVRLMAQLINEELRPGDTVGRVGAAKFALILPETGRHEAMKFAQSVKNKATWNWTLSVGVASYPGDASDSGSLISCSYNALLRAQRQGGNAVMLPAR